MAGKVLLTGGAGYIGSHTYVALREAGYDALLLDDFSNAAIDVPDRLSRLTGAAVDVIEANVADATALDRVFQDHQIDAVIHLAARKSVPQSLAQPQGFFDSNVAALLCLLKVMGRHGVHHIVYSSSATVYGQPKTLPIPEHAPLSYTNPYGLSKLMGEQFLNQYRRAGWAVGVLRYFNPAGAHASALIGEAPVKEGGNLMPLVARVARGELPELNIYGQKFETPDGTGVRDYIHVCDLARGHVQSLNRLIGTGRSHTVNLGRGAGHSVLDVIKCYRQVSGRPIPYRLRPRRPGDVAASYADPKMARSLLGFRALRNLEEMCRSSWAWERSKLQGDRVVPLWANVAASNARRANAVSLKKAI